MDQPGSYADGGGLEPYAISCGLGRRHRPLIALDAGSIVRMESYPDNCETGSWTVREIVRRPKTRFFTLLACVWVIVAAGASFPFWHGWPTSFSGLEWFCTALILMEIVFAVAAIGFWMTERPRIVREQHRNLECMRKA